MKNPYLNEIHCPLSQPKTRKSEVAQGGARSGGAARCAETLDNIKGRRKGNLVSLVKGRDRLSQEIFGNENVLLIFYIFILSLKK